VGGAAPAAPTPAAPTPAAPAAAPAPPPGLFLAAPPGLEPLLLAEARERGFAEARTAPGGVVVAGGLAEAMRANLMLRGAGRVLLRVAEFRALHPAQLDKRARRVDWAALLRPDVPVKVEATSRRSRIWHAGAAADRVAKAIRDGAGAAAGATGALRVLVRLDDDLCTISLDTSGEPLHRRGAKRDVGAAPLRETLAALILRAAAWTPGTPLLDPMCGSGTLPIEAAEIVAGLAPGRARAFAFERLAGFDPEAWAALRAAAVPAAPPADPPAILGGDRDAEVLAGARANAERAGVAPLVRFVRRAAGEAEPPEGPPGLVVVNPPYGARLGERDALRALHAGLGRALLDRFSGWRVALLTSEPGLARATGLPFAPPGPPFPHGPLKVRLHLTGPLP